MSSLLGHTSNDCAECGSCCNYDGPFPVDFYTMVTGCGRIGGMPPTTVWVEYPYVRSYCMDPCWWANVPHPVGVNNGLYRQLDVVTSVLNGSGGYDVTSYTYLWHTIMGDMYWVRVTGPGYYYEWKLQDNGVLYISDVQEKHLGRVALPGMGFCYPVVDVYQWDHFVAHEYNDPSVFISYTLSDPITMQDVLTTARGYCDQIDIVPDNAVIAVESDVNQTSNLECNGNQQGTPITVDVMRQAARRPGGVVMVTNNVGARPGSTGVGGGFYHPRTHYGAALFQYVEYGYGAPHGNTADELYGPWWFWSNLDTLACTVNKIKFALCDPKFCLAKWQYAATVYDGIWRNFNFPCGGPGHTGLPCDCDIFHVVSTYDYNSIRWVDYATIDVGCPEHCPDVDPPYPPYPYCVVCNPDTIDCDPAACSSKFDIVDHTRNVECTAIGSGSGNRIGNVTDLPQPCVTGLVCGIPCSGPVWYYDYTSCPVFGFVLFNPLTCPTSCVCAGSSDLEPAPPTI